MVSNSRPFSRRKKKKALDVLIWSVLPPSAQSLSAISSNITSRLRIGRPLSVSLAPRPPSGRRVDAGFSAGVDLIRLPDDFASTSAVPFLLLPHIDRSFVADLGSGVRQSLKYTGSVSISQDVSVLAGAATSTSRLNSYVSASAEMGSDNLCEEDDAPQHAQRCVGVTTRTLTLRRMSRTAAFWRLANRLNNMYPGWEKDGTHQEAGGHCLR
jgi:hypothetical protein